MRWRRSVAQVGAVVLGLWLWLVGLQAAQAAVPVVAAESTYGVVVKAIGGDQVAVRSIIENPNVDPHSFEASPQVAREVAGAKLVVMNGLGYDAWMDHLLAASPSKDRQVIVAAKVAPQRVMADRNPHLFYDPQAMLAVATRIAAVLSAADPTHKTLFERNLSAFRADIDRFQQRVAALAKAFPGLRVTATEPVYGYMLRDLGWKSLNNKFQVAVMNDAEPSPSEVAKFEDELRKRQVRLLIYNQQVSEVITQRMRAIAAKAGVPTVGVAEFVPPGLDYIAWQNQTLDAVERALGRKP